MKNNMFNFCPDCGSQNITTLMDGRRWCCPECGFELYNNIAAAVGVILTDASGRVLFERRAKNPKCGMLALPGGFCDADETALESVVRESMEELGIIPSDMRFIGAYPNTYEYKNIVYKTCDMFFWAKLPTDYDLKLQESEVSSTEWHVIATRDDVDGLPLAFESARAALYEWLRIK